MKNSIIDFLHAIPKIDESAKSVDEISRTLKNGDIPENERTIMCRTSLEYLRLFDVIEFDNQNIKLNESVSKYFIDSLAWFFENDIPIFSNWGRKGTSLDISSNKLADRAPFLLKVMEEKRLSLIENEGLPQGNTRELDVVILLINRNTNRESHFLYQLDQHSGGYQLIGGKVQRGEKVIDAAKREIDEEIRHHDLVYERDYSLLPLNQSEVKELFISNSEGALTSYNFHLFHVQFKIDQLSISKELDRWIPISYMRIGETDDGKKIPYSKFFTTFDNSISGGLGGLSPSIKDRRFIIVNYSMINWYVVVKFLTFMIMVLSIFWFLNEYAYEPIIVFIGGLIGFITAFVKD